MTGVFISYSQKDRPSAAALAHKLEKDGFNVWWDTELVGGEVFREIITQKLEDAAAVIVLWSANSAASRFVIDEADVAAATGKMISVLLPEFRPGQTPLGFRSFQAVAYDDYPSIVKSLDRRGAVVNLSMAENATSAPAPAGSVTQLSTQSDAEAAREEKAWQFVLQRRDQKLIDKFLREFPNGAYAAEARRRWHQISGFRSSLMWGIPVLLMIIAALAGLWAGSDTVEFITLLLLGFGPIALMLVLAVTGAIRRSRRALQHQEKKYQR